MNRALQQSFANSYPQRSSIVSLDLSPIQKTKIKENYTGVKKRSLWIVIIIVIVAAMIYSSMAYTVSNYVFEYFNIDMFNSQGEPNIFIQIIHSIILGIAVYLILYYN